MSTQNSKIGGDLLLQMKTHLETTTISWPNYRCNQPTDIQRKNRIMQVKCKRTIFRTDYTTVTSSSQFIVAVNGLNKLTHWIRNGSVLHIEHCTWNACMWTITGTNDNKAQSIAQFVRKMELDNDHWNMHFLESFVGQSLSNLHDPLDHLLALQMSQVL